MESTPDPQNPLNLSLKSLVPLALAGGGIGVLTSTVFLQHENVHQVPGNPGSAGPDESSDLYF